MPILPLSPHLKTYQGAKPELRRKNSAANATAVRIAEYVNGLIANNPDDLQQYYFASIASDLDVTTDQVRNAISDGGFNGITISVRAEDRQKLKRYEASGSE